MLVRKNFYYGWVIVASLFVMLTFTSGLGFYNHSVMLNALVLERGFPIGVASSAVSIFFLSSGVAGLWFASLLEKYDVRISIVIGGLLAGIGLMLIGKVSEIWQLYVVYALFGIGFCGSGLLPAITLITRWFQRSRAFALSIASTGLSIGGVIITPFSAVIIAHNGIEEACLWFGLAFLLGVIPLSLITLRSNPGDLGLEIDGAKKDTSEQAVKTPPIIDGVSFAKALRDRYFWGVSFAYLFIMLAQAGAISHQYGVITERVDQNNATLALTILPLFSILGRLAGGYFMNRLSIRVFTICMMLIQCVAMSALALSHNEVLFLASLAVFGITVGNLLMLQPLILAEAFGLLSYSRIFSVSNLLTTCGLALGPALLGYIYELDHQYVGPFLLAALSSFVAMIIYATVSSPTKISIQATTKN